MLKAIVCVVCVVGVALATFADDMPFWGEGSPSTNRNTTVSHTTAVIQNFSSFAFSWHIFNVPKFDSRRNGFVIVFN